MENIEFKTDLRRARHLVAWKYFFWLASVVAFVSFWVGWSHYQDFGGPKPGQMAEDDALALFCIFFGGIVLGWLIKFWRWARYVNPRYVLSANHIEIIKGFERTGTSIKTLPLKKIRKLQVISTWAAMFGYPYRDILIDFAGDESPDMKLLGIANWEEIKAEIERRSA